MSVFLFFRKQNYHCNLGKTASAGQSHAARCRGVAILFHQVMNLRWPLQSTAAPARIVILKALEPLGGGAWLAEVGPRAGP